MVVPLGEGRQPRVHVAQVRVEHVVKPLAAILVERLGHLALGVRQHDVAPGAAALQLDHLLHRPVGVDRVARVDEEVGLAPGDGRVGPHALGVDAPALPGRVARPGEAHVAAVGRRGAEAPDDRLGDGVHVVEILRREAVEHVLARGQVGQQALDGEVARGQRVDRGQLARVREALGGGDLGADARGAVHPRPDHARAGVHVARLDAVGEARPSLGARQRGRGEHDAERGAAREDGASARAAGSARREESSGHGMSSSGGRVGEASPPNHTPSRRPRDGSVTA